MELDDLDLDGSWPLHQIAFASSTLGSPVVYSSSDEPCSPLWTFSDAASAFTDGSKLCSASAAAGAPPRFSDYSVLLTRTPSSETETEVQNPDNGKFPSLFWSTIPPENPDSYCVIKARMTQALRYFKESTGQQHVLAQVWAPVKNRGRYVLATSGQPFVLDPNSNGLNQYRMVSLMYVFSVDSETDGELGLPGRVFRKKLPEWTPNVQYYSSKEFSRLVHALHYNVQGTLALPVFEPSKQLCVGVVELIMTSQKINYAPEFEKVCKALEAVNLKTSEILNHETAQICNEGRRNALAEILEVLTVVCETYKLPLAQTWVPCRHQSILAYGGGFKKSCSSFDGSCMGRVCMSTSDLAFYVVDAHMWGFREACAEHHLQKGQGAAGRAFLSGSLCFCRDVTKFCKTDYPLVHYARIFKLTRCFAICLRSTHTGDDEYVLEFFLPPAITNKGEEEDCLLGQLLATMKPHFRSLKVASGIELCEGEASVETVQASEDGVVCLRLEPIRMHPSAKSAPRSNASPVKDDLQLDLPEKEPFLSSDPRHNKANAMERNGIAGDSAPLPELKVTKKSERKRGKTEKTISLEVLQQYFAGSLKDAAKSLGVCPTTMKRICRQHGISRWPSRKINKVNRSLTKLKHFIDSVQGADGAIDLASLSSSPFPFVGSMSRVPNLNGSPRQISPASEPHENQPTEPGSPSSRSPRRCFQDVKIEQQDGTGSGEESGGSSPTSHGSCEGNPFQDNISRENTVADCTQEQCFAVIHPSRKHFQLPIEPCSLLRPDSQDTFREMLVEDSGSSKGLSNLWTHSACDTTSLSELMRVPRTTLDMEDKQELLKPISVKATYKEDIIRFKIPPILGVTELKHEVAKRLKLEVGAFDLKYLDDDSELVWVLCDADLRECLDISASSGCRTLRLSVYEGMPNFGTSCESTEEL